jgi:hypothetical protein
MSQLDSPVSISIYQVPVPELFRPARSPFRYPSYSRDYGVEQDFSTYLNSSFLTTTNIQLATHIYLPIYWTRYWLQNNYGEDGHAPLNDFLDSLGLDWSKTFTVCQYDDGPLVNFDFGGGLYLASRKTLEVGRDIPLLASNLPRIKFGKKGRYLMSFAGRYETHPLRMDLHHISRDRKSVFLAEGSLNARRFASLLRQSLVVLCPRGYGGSSFRFYEAMQVGSVPCLIGDVDTRPFKAQIDWDKVSFYFKTPVEAISAIEAMDPCELKEMGKNASEVYHGLIKFGKWNHLLINDLLQQSG